MNIGDNKREWILVEKKWRTFCWPHYKCNSLNRNYCCNYIKIALQYSSILKKTIREAKIQYYDKLFSQYKSDIMKTWQTISDIICKSNKKRKTLDKIIVDSKIITNKEEICNEFNVFFANIGPKLATQIKPTWNKTYDTFLKKRVLMYFAFTLVGENDVLKYLSSLRTKKSAGFDGISVKLLKRLSSALINPLTLIINQSFLTGIFPKNLKIAKVLPLFFRKMIIQSWIINVLSHYWHLSQNFLKKLFLPSFTIIFEITICSMIVSMDFWKITQPNMPPWN